MSTNYHANLTIRPRSPYDFDLSASIFSGGEPSFSRYESGRFSQALRLRDGLALSRVTSAGEVEKPVLKARLSSNYPLEKKEKDEAGDKLSWILNLDLDLQPFYNAVHEDPVLSDLTRDLRGLKSPRTPSVYEALVDSIIEQQISLGAAHAMQRRLVLKYGDQLEVGGLKIYAFPGPGRLAAATPEGLRECGLSWKKTEYVITISRAIHEGALDLESLSGLSGTDEMIGELRKLRGVGTWTAELTLLRGLGRLDAFPADDLGIRRLISRTYSGGRAISGEEARVIAERWGNWKGLSAFYLIMAEKLQITSSKSDLR
ncbi:MAG: hypothetical protein LUQ25_00735 [Methanoregulaceae archaeon]|nr:hypothetical protein [Methanoregulaceae archaeon]